MGRVGVGGGLPIEVVQVPQVDVEVLAVESVPAGVLQDDRDADGGGEETTQGGHGGVDAVGGGVGGQVRPQGSAEFGGAGPVGVQGQVDEQVQGGAAGEP